MGNTQGGGEVESNRISRAIRQPSRRQTENIQDVYLSEEQMNYQKFYSNNLIRGRVRRAEEMQKLVKAAELEYGQVEQSCFETPLPNKYTKLQDLRFDTYNSVLNGDGSLLLLTSRESLSILNREKNYAVEQEVYPENVNWTITDADISNDGRFLIQSSLNETVSLFDLTKKKYVDRFIMTDDQHEQDLDHHYYGWANSLRLFSIKYDQSAKFFIASTAKIHSQGKAFLKVYDLKADRVVRSIPAHEDDINSLVYLDKRNHDIFISASDDRTIRVWDQRALGIQNRPIGYFLGHVSGITSVASREDGNYLASNGKDQALKLWDLRKIVAEYKDKPFKNMSFDYRGTVLAQSSIERIKKLKQTENFDNSVHSFYGQVVSRTLIRCHFSPARFTNKRYIYSASADGTICIYDIFNLSNAAYLKQPNPTVIRDCIWHPQDNQILVGDWASRMSSWSFDSESTGHQKEIKNFRSLHSSQEDYRPPEEEYYYYHQQNQEEEEFGDEEEDEDEYQIEPEEQSGEEQHEGDESGEEGGSGLGTHSFKQLSEENQDEEDSSSKGEDSSQDQSNHEQSSQNQE